MVDVNAIQRFPELGYGPQDFKWKKVRWQLKNGTSLENSDEVLNRASSPFRRSFRCHRFPQDAKAPYSLYSYKTLAYGRLEKIGRYMYTILT